MERMYGTHQCIDQRSLAASLMNGQPKQRNNTLVSNGRKDHHLIFLFQQMLKLGMIKDCYRLNQLDKSMSGDDSPADEEIP